MQARWANGRRVPWQTLSRFGSLFAGAGALGFAGVYFLLAWRVVFVLRIGPTAVTVSDGRGWGVHTGDALALPLVLLGLVCVGLTAVWWQHALRRPAPPAAVVPIGWERRHQPRSVPLESAA